MLHTPLTPGNYKRNYETGKHPNWYETIRHATAQHWHSGYFDLLDWPFIRIKLKTRAHFLGILRGPEARCHDPCWQNWLKKSSSSPGTTLSLLRDAGVSPPKRDTEKLVALFEMNIFCDGSEVSETKRHNKSQKFKGRATKLSLKNVGQVGAFPQISSSHGTFFWRLLPRKMLPRIKCCLEKCYLESNAT